MFAVSLAAAEWPGFRGPAASGVLDGQRLPSSWTEKNIRWKTAIEGLSHSSPIVWGDRVFVTTAVSSDPGATFKRGLYGAGTASEDRSPHQWKLICLDLSSGKILWSRTAYEGAPKEKRHIKSTYANATPVTDGSVVIAFFGSQGVYAYDFNGKQLWSRDLGVFDAGAYDAPQYEWGVASSPALFRDLVILQCDQQKNSFLIALDRSTGKTVWKTERDELPSWGTPNVLETGGRAELVTNGSNAVRGYDPRTGKQLWSIGGSSKITAPTPVASAGITIVASGRRPEAPIFAIRSGEVIWQKQQRGPYMPTPLIYGELLYALNNNGVFDCYELKTGKEVYRERIEHGGSGFSASPVASDGVIYLSSEDGDVFAIRAGAKFEILARTAVGEPLMATPAIASKFLLIRGQKHLFAISN